MISDRDFRPTPHQVFVLKDQHRVSPGFPFAQVSTCKKERKTFDVRFLPAFAKQVVKRYEIFTGPGEEDHEHRAIRPALPGGSAMEGERLCTQPYNEKEYRCRYSEEYNGWVVKAPREYYEHTLVLQEYDPEMEILL